MEGETYGKSAKLARASGSTGAGSQVSGVHGVTKNEILPGLAITASRLSSAACTNDPSEQQPSLKELGSPTSRLSILVEICPEEAPFVSRQSRAPLYDVQNVESARLLASCAAGDASALRDLYLAQAPRLYGLALRVTDDAGLAADAVHDAFVQIWKNAGKFDANAGDARAWFTGIVRYRALDIKRLRAREKLVSEVPERENDAADPLEELLRSDEAAVLHVWLNLLTPQFRKMLVAVYFNDLSQNEIAAKYGMPIGTIKSSIRRALLRLKTLSYTSDGNVVPERVRVHS